MSLLETRALINLMKKSTSSFTTIFLLLVDLIITFLIFALLGYFFFLGIIIFFLRRELPTDSFESFLRVCLQILDAIQFKNELSIFLYSTFFTSIWLWLYAISGFIIKITSSTRKSLLFFQRNLDIVNKPLRSMALVLITLITLAYLIIAIFLLF